LIRWPVLGAYDGDRARPTIPVKGGPDAGALLHQMRAEERY
jgi:hypothetical protein